jgi:hypothetical protein
MATMRGPNPLRNVRQAVPDRTEAPSRTAVLEDQVHQQMVDQFLPQVAEESEQAAKPARVAFLYYRKKRTGRRCSCYHVETTPEGQCQICYGGGFVGGWDLHGCRTEWIDVTHENLRLVNCRADFNAGTRPIYFTIDSGETSAFIETDINVLRNIQRLEGFQLGVGNRQKNSSIQAFVQAEGDLAPVPFTEAALNARLGNLSLKIRIELKRNNTSIESPRLSHLMIRYRLIPEIKMFGDMNLGDSSFELGDLGFTDTFTTLSLFLPKSFDYVSNEDFMVRLSDQKRFKVTKFTRNAVSGILLSHLVLARLLVPGTDLLNSFP